MADSNYLRLAPKGGSRSGARAVGIRSTMHCSHADTICETCLDEWLEDYDVHVGGHVYTAFGRRILDRVRAAGLAPNGPGLKVGTWPELDALHAIQDRIARAVDHPERWSSIAAHSKAVAKLVDQLLAVEESLKAAGGSAEGMS